MKDIFVFILFMIFIFNVFTSYHPVELCEAEENKEIINQDDFLNKNILNDDDFDHIICPCQNTNINTKQNCGVPLLPHSDNPCYVMDTFSIDRSSNKNDPPIKSIFNLPIEFSWKNYSGLDWTTSVKNQGFCGSCWAFAALGALESVINIAWNDSDLDIDLSEQYVISCLRRAGGCGGGWTERAYKYIQSETPDGNFYNGIISESCFPYQGISQISCSDKCPEWKNQLIPIEDYGFWLPIDKDEIKSQIISNGPVVGYMQATSEMARWGREHHDPDEYYINTTLEPGLINHAVVIVGWKDDPSIETGGYWIIKNSWGTEWGYDGFFNLAYNSLNIDSVQITWVEYSPGPLVNFQFTPSKPIIEDIILFAGSAYSPKGDIVSWFWDFGDGNSSTIQNPEYSYSSNGTYSVTLTVIDDYGYNDTVSKIIRIGDPVTRYVGGFGPNNYSKIQDAINTSYDGDTIYVFSGNYNENILIDKTLSLIGEGKETTIINGNNKSDIIYSYADRVNITGFTIKNMGTRGAYGEYFAGIYINADNNTISDNNIMDNQIGIIISYTSCNGTKIIKNVFINNWECTICRTVGVYYETYMENYDTVISENIISNTFYSLNLRNEINCTVSDNIIKHVSCLFLDKLYTSSFVNNKIEYHDLGLGEIESVGIILVDTQPDSLGKNMIVGNTIINTSYGIFLYSSNNNTLYHNNVIGTNQTALDYSSNIWFNESLGGGNYWSDYNGTDLDRNGIGDILYNISGGSNQDLYPLIHPFILGDMNLDEDVNWRDIEPFRLALENVTGYQNLYHTDPGINGDINQDGVLNWRDIDPFVELLQS